MNRNLSFLVMGMFTCLAVVAQDSGNAANNQNNAAKKFVSPVGVSLGASVNYYYGPGDRNFGDFESDRVNWQVNGMLGVGLTSDRNGRRTMLGAFGSLGFNNRQTINNLLADHGYVSTATSQRGANNFYLLEGGLLIAETVRISTGVGQQNFDKQTLVDSDGRARVDETSLQFNSTTVGFNVNFPAVTLTINCNVAYGKDFERTVITPSAGLMVNL